MFTTLLATPLAQDSAFSAGRTAGAALLPLLGIVLLATGIGIRARRRRAGGQNSSRGAGWLIGIGAFLLFAGVVSVAGAAT